MLTGLRTMFRMHRDYLYHVAVGTVRRDSERGGGVVSRAAWLCMRVCLTLGAGQEGGRERAGDTVWVDAGPT